MHLNTENLLSQLLLLIAKAIQAMAPTQINIKVSINLVIFVEGLSIYSPAKLKLRKELQSSFSRCKHSAYFNINDTYMKNMITNALRKTPIVVASNAMLLVTKPLLQHLG